MTLPTQSTRGAMRDVRTTRLDSQWRIFIRIGALLVVAAAIALVVASIPAQIAVTGKVCASTNNCLSSQLTPQAAATLQHAGISLRSYMLISVILRLGSTLLWFVAGAVLLRRSDDRMALIVGIQAITQGASASAYFPATQPLWSLLANAMGVLNNIMLFYGFALFPSGRFVPSWMRWAAVIWILLQPIEALSAFNGLAWPLFIVALLVLAGCQIYRYRRVSNPVERQQTKVVIAAFAIIVVAVIGLSLPAVFIPSLGGSNDVYGIAANMVSTLVLLLGPIALVFAVYRYRLFDIDVLINRALVYGSLSAVLVAVYFASVLAAQALIQVFTEQTKPQPPIVVASTLLVAALFGPLRRRIQTAIDRQFYRAKYDAARTLETFAATLRSETDLNGLPQHLLGVVRETMQPAHVSLWLTPTRGEAQP